MPTTDTPTLPAIEGQACKGLAPRICSSASLRGIILEVCEISKESADCLWWLTEHNRSPNEHGEDWHSGQAWQALQRIKRAIATIEADWTNA